MELKWANRAVAAILVLMLSTWSQAALCPMMMGCGMAPSGTKKTAAVNRVAVHSCCPRTKKASAQCDMSQMQSHASKTACCSVEAPPAATEKPVKVAPASLVVGQTAEMHVGPSNFEHSVLSTDVSPPPRTVLNLKQDFRI